MANHAPLPPIQFNALSEALLARSDTLLPAWLPGGIIRNHEYVCGSLDGGKGSSCSVNVTTGKWSDFATGIGGHDLLSLYAAIHDLSQGKAALQVSREEGLEDVAGVQPARGDAPAAPKPPRPEPEPKAAPARSVEGWVTTAPVPQFAPKPTFFHQYRTAQDIEHTAAYRIDGALFGYVVRFKTSDGGKETLPYTWCTSARDGASKWHWRTWDGLKPLYFPGGKSPLERVHSDGTLPTVILVEGEKKACILHDVLEQFAPGVYVVVSWPGGCNGWRKADWSHLNGCTVLLWPDCDGKRVPLTKAEKAACLDDAALDMARAAKPLLPEQDQPGMKAMMGIGALLRDTHACTVSLLPIPAPLTVKDGWDCADAIETDGWDGARVLAFFGRAQALPAAPAAANTKKSDGPVNTPAADLDDGRTTIIAGKPIPDWLLCYYNAPRKTWWSSRKMIIEILERDEQLAPVLAFNELSNTVQNRVAWPWPYGNGKSGDMASETHLMLNYFLSKKYGLPSFTPASLTEAIQTVAHTRRFHPIREYLQNVVWDGKPRIDKWLMFCLGETPESLSKAMTEYLQIVGRCWLLGMVKRAIEPGCKFDYCPVLEGSGGLRKSTLVEILAGSYFYSDTPFDVAHGKEAQEQVQGRWVYEIAELSNFSKADVGLIKGFISSKIDRYRAAYAATVGSFPRQCIMVGTTNENTYLRDRTGNRRFWPIPVRHIINTEWVQKYRDQLLAEAYALLAQNPALSYTPTNDQEVRLFAPMQASRLQESAVASELLHIFTRPPNATAGGTIVNDLTQFVTMAQVTMALGLDAAKCSLGLAGEIRSWFLNQGWVSAKKQIQGARANGYVRPANWPPKDDSEEMVSAPTGACPDPSTAVPGDDEPF